MIGNSGTNIMFSRGGSDTYRAGDGIDWISLSTLGLTDGNSYAGVDGFNTIIVDQRTTGPFSYDIIYDFDAGKDRIDVSAYDLGTFAAVQATGGQRWPRQQLLRARRWARLCVPCRPHYRRRYSSK
ncbi:MAG: hypothetical protein AB7U95_28675, partial [Reyranella sp.]